MRFDLHMHSDASSDGQLSPAELARMAHSTGLNVIALSDHDSIVNVPAMIQEGARYGIDVIPAIEISTSLGDADVHLLGYGIDLNDPWIGSLREKSRRRMEGLFHQRVQKLSETYGLDIDEEAILKKSGTKSPWFTLIEDLLSRPEVQSLEDFQDYLPGGRRSVPAPVNFFWDRCQAGSPLYVHAGHPDLKECIRKVHEAGGLAIIAHPFRTFYQQDKVLEELIEAGLDGLEVYSNYHEPDQTAWYLDFARRHHLLISCGSDFHGEKKPNIQMGQYHLDQDGTPFLDAIQNALKEQR